MIPLKIFNFNHMKSKIVTLGLLLLFCALSCNVKRGITDETAIKPAGTKSTGKIAVAATGENENSEISDIAGRAPFFLIFDEDGNFLKSVKNPALSFGGGASAEVVNLLVRESCKTFVAGQFGFKMQAQLRSNNIEYIQKQGLAKDVIKLF
jgi:predicted Fe-Mo cluster-binding NifX family protein